MPSNAYHSPYELQDTLEPWRKKLEPQFDEVVSVLVTRERELFDNLGVGRWLEYTPTLTSLLGNPTLGTGSSQFGTYTRFGRSVFGTARIEFGNAGVAAGGAGYEVLLPTPREPLPITTGATFVVVGYGYIYDVSTASRWTVICDVNPSAASTTCNMTFTDATGSFYVGGTNPFTFAAGDQITLCFMYDGAEPI